MIPANIEKFFKMINNVDSYMQTVKYDINDLLDMLQTTNRERKEALDLLNDNNKWVIDDNDNSIVCTGTNIFFKNDYTKMEWTIDEFISHFRMKDYTTHFALLSKIEDVMDIDYFLRLIKQSDLSETLKKFRDNGLKIHVLFHVLFGTNSILHSWFDTELFTDIFKILKDDYEKHLMAEIFANCIGKNFERKQELKNCLDNIKDIKRTKHVAYIITYISVFYGMLSEEEENILVGRLKRKKCLKQIDMFDKIKPYHKSSQDIVNSLIFINKLAAGE